MQSAFFGQYLLNKGLINAQQLAKALALQEVMNKRTGDLAIELGLLNRQQVRAIVELQKKEDIYFGEAAKKLLLMTKPQVDALLKIQKERHVYIGDAVVKLGYIGEEQREKALMSYVEEQNENAATITPYCYPESISPLRPFIEKFTLYTIKIMQRMCGTFTKFNNYKMIENEPLLAAIYISVDCRYTQKKGAVYYTLFMCEEMEKIITAKICRNEEMKAEHIAKEAMLSELVNIICGLSCDSLQDFTLLSAGVPKITTADPRPTFPAERKTMLVSLISPYGQIEFMLNFIGL